jgi:two-component system OmpR family response regulator
VRQAEKKCRILVVDADLDEMHSLAYLLSEMGHEVRSAMNGNAALDVASTFQPQVVLLDLGLPGRDGGCEIARRLRAQAGFAARIVAMAKQSSDEDRERTLAAGCEFHLVKPVEAAVMEKVVLVSC